ncbi:MAG: 2-dehydropantoate 2-reductase [Candidatus Omnitrophica bacterium]|nr:2-dehydropantoate 2-reductase [Candidatus Omnitrophota bacterium]
MKIAIVGPGAIGCLLAGLLSRQKGRHDVWLLDKHPQRAKKIKESGITIEGVTAAKQSVNITADAKLIGQSELVVIATKSYDTESALASIKPLLSGETNVMSLQNGIGNLQLVSDMVGQDRTVCAITSHGATLISDGRVKHTGKGDTVIGKLDGKLFRDVRHISNALNDAGIMTKTSKDIGNALWSKLIINAGINPLSAICRVPNGVILKREGIKELMRQLVIEAVKVAKKNKIKLIFDDPLAKVESVCQSTADNISSMLQDVLNKKRTEIDFINGAISRYAKNAGIKTPVNDTIVCIIKAIEDSYKEQAGI